MISLAALEAADKAATPGPWYWSITGTELRAPTPYGGVLLMFADPAADQGLIPLLRNGTPALVAALRAVLALHPETQSVGGGYRYCPACFPREGVQWPCRTVQAITDAGVEP